MREVDREDARRFGATARETSPYAGVHGILSEVVGLHFGLSLNEIEEVFSFLAGFRASRMGNK